MGESGLMANRTILARENFLWPGSPLHTLAASLKGDEGMGLICAVSKENWSLGLRDPMKWFQTL